MPTAQDITKLLAFDPNTIAHVGATSDGHIYVRLLDGSLQPLFTDAAAAMGLVIRADVASTANVSLSAPGTIDGVMLSDGAIVLLRAQTNPIENGVYTYDQANDLLERNTIFDSVEDITGDAMVLVTDGTTTSGVWALDNVTPVTLDTDALTFTFVALASGSSPLPAGTANQLLQYNGGAWVAISDVELPEGALRYLRNKQPTTPGTAGGSMRIYGADGADGSGATPGAAGGGGAVFGGAGGDGTGAVAAGAGGAATLTGGAAGANGGGGGANSGGALVDAGVPSGAGTAGTVSIGTTNASAIASGHGSIVWTHTGGIVASSYLAVGASPAGSGAGRFGNAAYLAWNSNPGGTALNALAVDASNNLLVGTSGANGVSNAVYDVKAAGSHSFKVDGANQAVVGVGYLALGTSPATAGLLRMPYGQSLYFGDGAGANTRAISMAAGGALVIGLYHATLGTATIGYEVNAGGNHQFKVNNVLQATIGDGYLGLGATTATVGTVRGGETLSIYGLTSLSADRSLLSWAANVLTLGNSTNQTIINGSVAGGSSVLLQNGGTTHLKLSNAGIEILPTTFRWEATATTPTLTQADETAAATVGQPMTIQAQNSQGAGSTGGILALRGGLGDGNNQGAVRIYSGANIVMEASYGAGASKWSVFGVAPAARAAAYTPTNVTPDRSFDADTALPAEIADVLGTLIADLQAYGILQ